MKAYSVKMKKRLKNIACGVLVAAFWLTLWYVCALAVGNPIIFPTPTETVVRLFELMLTKEFLKFTLASLARVIAGILFAVPAAFAAAAVCSYSRVADRLFEPAVLLMRSIPVVSFILIAVFIFERGIIPSAITFIMIFPVLYRNLREGISQTPRELLEMADVFRLSTYLKIKNVYLPAVMPYFYSALTTSVGLGIKAGIAAEVVAYIPSSIGKKLSDAKSYMEPADLLAWTAVIVILSLLIEKAIRLLIGRRMKNA